MVTSRQVFGRLCIGLVIPPVPNKCKVARGARSQPHPTEGDEVDDEEGQVKAWGARAHGEAVQRGRGGAHLKDRWAPD